MIICICKSISDRDLEEYINDCTSLEDFLRITGIGSECGTCIKDVKEKYKESQQCKKQSS